MRYLEIAPNANRGLNWDSVRDVPTPGCMVYDMRKLPMKGVMDDQYNAVYSEHFVEHLHSRGAGSLRPQFYDATTELDDKIRL